MKQILLLLAIAFALSISSCGHSAFSGSATDPDTFSTPDLRLNELRGHVKSVRSVTYLSTRWEGDSLIPDTAAVNRMETTAYFDSLGNYVSRRHEKLRRDSRGHIVRWEDRRPNLPRLHGGYLRDTLGYTYLSPNVIQSSGMGEKGIAVYDEHGRIVSQYTQPLVDGAPNAASNIFRASDRNGNWTERITVWTTHAPGLPSHVSYTLTRRTIEYHPN